MNIQNRILQKEEDMRTQKLNISSARLKILKRFIQDVQLQEGVNYQVLLDGERRLNISFSVPEEDMDELSVKEMNTGSVFYADESADEFADNNENLYEKI